MKRIGVCAALVCGGALLWPDCASHGRLRALPARPEPPPLIFSVTAYCQGTMTKAGTPVARGVIAADPAVLPLGTEVHVGGLSDEYDGDYVVLDTGARIRGRHIDLYMRSCREAVRFGRRRAEVTIIEP